MVPDVHHTNILLYCLDRLEENAIGKVDKATDRKCLFCFRRSTESKYPEQNRKCEQLMERKKKNASNDNSNCFEQNNGCTLAL